jgi:hypothetical protein
MPRKHNKVSRQRKYQIRMTALDRCTICGKKPLETSYYCKKHAQANRERSLRRYYAKREAGE